MIFLEFYGMFKKKKILLGWIYIKWKIHTRNRSWLVCCDLLFTLRLRQNKSPILSEFPGKPPGSYCSNFRLVHDWVQFLSRIPDYFKDDVLMLSFGTRQHLKSRKWVISRNSKEVLKWLQNVKQRTLPDSLTASLTSPAKTLILLVMPGPWKKFSPRLLPDYSDHCFSSFKMCLRS